MRVIFIGGGLSSCLLALAIKRINPQIQIAIYEKNPEICLGPTWSFFGTDVDQDFLFSLIPKDILVKNSSYEVLFENFQRELSSEYFTMLSSSFRNFFYTRFPDIAVHKNHPVDSLSHLNLKERDLVFDSAGLSRKKIKRSLAYQKFYGLHCLSETNHEIKRTRIMDACIDQKDGFRFVYLIPLNAKEFLVEDTYYSDTVNLDFAEADKDLKNYLDYKLFLKDKYKVLNCENGCLAIPLESISRKAFKNWFASSNTIPIGLSAEHFHHATGYSFGHSLRTAQIVAKCLNESHIDINKIRGEILKGYLRTLAKSSFFIKLNKFVFYSAEAKERASIYKMFYKKHSQPLIERFYADRLTSIDKFRILALIPPPVPVSAALKALLYRPGIK